MNVNLVAPAEAEALAAWLATHAASPATGCLFTWSNQGTRALALEIAQTLDVSQRWAMARDGNGVICGAMGVRWVPGRGHGWLHGPVVSVDDPKQWRPTVLALSEATMTGGPMLASLSAFPTTRNESTLAFLQSQGLRVKGGAAHVFALALPETSGPSTGAVPLQPSHWPSFARVFNDHFPHLGHMLDYLEDLPAGNTKSASVHVAVGNSDDDVVGLVIARTRPFRGAELVALAVKPEARGRGIGAQLLAAAVDFACGADQPRMELTVLNDAAAAIRLYERQGWQRVGTGLDLRT